MRAMRWLRPKSLTGLMLLGLALLALPLLVAIVTAALQFRRLSTTGQKIVIEGVTAARESQRLFSEIDSLERTARLYDVLDDPRLLQLYKHQDALLTATRGELYAQSTAGTRQTLMQLADVQRQIRTRVLTTPPGTQAANAAGLGKLFAQLGSLVDRTAQQSKTQRLKRHDAVWPFESLDTEFFPFVHGAVPESSAIGRLLKIRFEG